MPQAYAETKDSMGGQHRTFCGWVNVKLREGGFTPVGYESMFEDMQNGVALAHLLQSLTGRHIEGIKQQPKNPLVIQANLQILWELMENREEIDLGGITSISVSQGNPTSVMALIWRLILQYDLGSSSGSSPSSPKSPGGISQLLRWVEGRTSQITGNSVVKNFSSNWNNGVLLHALWLSVMPDQPAPSSDPIELVSYCLREFSVQLAVPDQMVVADEITVAQPDKKVVVAYVICLKAAIEKFEQEKIERAEAKLSEQSAQMLLAGQLFQQGLAGLLNANKNGVHENS